jgi:hypothetical protein
MKSLQLLVFLFLLGETLQHPDDLLAKEIESLDVLVRAYENTYQNLSGLPDSVLRGWRFALSDLEDLRIIEARRKEAGSIVRTAEDLEVGIHELESILERFPRKECVEKRRQDLKEELEALSIVMEERERLTKLAESDK